GPASAAHHERRHGRVLAVVRGLAKDREPGAAVRAVEERVAVPAVGGVEQLGEAGVAGSDVGPDENRAVALGFARLDPERVVPERPPRRPAYLVDLSQRRGARGRLPQGAGPPPRVDSPSPQHPPPPGPVHPRAPTT